MLHTFGGPHFKRGLEPKKTVKMKDKDQDVSGLLAKLSLRNNLDGEEEEVIESIQILEKDEDQDNDEYISKGPIR